MTSGRDCVIIDNQINRIDFQTKIDMISKVVKIKDLKDQNAISDDLKYWLEKSPEERVAAVDYLRKQLHGDSARLQRIVRVIQRS